MEATQPELLVSYNATHEVEDKSMSPAEIGQAQQVREYT